MTWRWWAMVAVLLVVGALAQTSAQEPAPRPGPDEPLTIQAGGRQVRVVLVAGGLVGPWSIAFLPDGETLLVTESPGRLRIVRGRALAPETVWEA